MGLSLSLCRTSVEGLKVHLIANANKVEQTRAAVESGVNQLPENVETMKTEYAAKSRRRFKDVSKAISATVDVIDDVNTQVSVAVIQLSNVISSNCVCVCLCVCVSVCVC